MLVLIDCGERHPERSLLGHQYAARSVAFDHSDIVVPGRAEMRRHENIEPEIIATRGRGEVARDDQHVAPRVGRDAQPQRIARVLVDDLDRRHTGRQQPQRIVLVALDLGPETVGAGDDEPEIADLREIDTRVIDLVDDAEADREP